MIEFANEHTRTEFHLLPAEMQKEYNEIALRLASSGQVVTVLDIDKWGFELRHLEISIRVDKKFNPLGVSA